MIGGGEVVRTIGRVAAFTERLHKYVDQIRARRSKERMAAAGTFLAFAEALGLTDGEREQIATALRSAAQTILEDVTSEGDEKASD